MIEVTKDFHACTGYKVIPTNGWVEGGEAEMSGGLALDVAYKCRAVAEDLGALIEENVHVTQIIGTYGEDTYISFPVKPIKAYTDEGLVVPGWACKADLSIINESAKGLHSLGLKGPVYVPRVGCGNGLLNWDDVAPVLRKHLKEDNYIVLV